MGIFLLSVSCLIENIGFIVYFLIAELFYMVLTFFLVKKLRAHPTLIHFNRAALMTDFILVSETRLFSAGCAGSSLTVKNRSRPWKNKTYNKLYKAFDGIIHFILFC